MARIQHSIDIGLPVHVVYNQLTQFEDYPRFMQEVETVHQLDDTHLHWSAKMSYQPLEWDSEIVEQIPDRCIAWRNEGGPLQSGKLELQPVDQGKARVTMTVECDPGQVPAERQGNPEQMVAQRLEDDLARFKFFLESRGAETGEWRGEVHEAQVTGRDGDAGTTPSQAAGESMGKAVGRTASEQRESAQSSPSGMRQADQPMQSASSLSQSPDAGAEDGRFSVAEEQNFDQQSDQARRVGQMPLDFNAPVPGETDPSDAMVKSVKDEEKKGLQQSIERSVPPSE